MKQTQEAMILSDLKRGWKVSGLTALRRHGVYRLSEVIRKLRAKGYEIECVMIHEYDEQGHEINRYGEYRLV